MTDHITIAIDAMGGENSPDKTIEGISHHLKNSDNSFYLIFGNEKLINPLIKKYKISTKYQFLDEIFLRVLEKHPEKMSDIFFKMFKASPKTVIKFLSNKSNFFEDLSIILRMPKLTFIKALFY